MKSKKPVLEVIGGNSERVTGSCTKIQFNDKTYLFEFGGIQDGKTALESYRLNRKQIQKVKPKEIQAVIISHCHHDHQGLIPALFKAGHHIRVIVPKGSTPILKEMWMDSCFINQRDSEYLTQKTGSVVEPLYTEDDVKEALSHVEEFESNQILPIDEDISIRYIPAGHILLSQQCEVFIGKNHTHKVLFTGDLGNLKIQDMKFYIEKFQPAYTANIVIGECTYGAKGREGNKDALKADIQKIRTVIEQFCVEGKGRVLIPTFALDRTLYFLSILYDILGEENKIPIILDSPLAIRLLKIYGEILSEESLVQYNKIMNWKSLKMITESKESKMLVEDKAPKVILSASGMMTAGRSIFWTKSLLPKSSDCILFAGYCGEDTLGYRIRNEKKNKTINICGKPIKNKCSIVELTSFSSHMQRSDLLNYYKNIHCDKIYLVHGDMNSKLEFKSDLEDAIHDTLRTTKVVVTNKSTKITL